MFEHSMFTEEFVLVRPLSDDAKPVPRPEILREMRLLLLEATYYNAQGKATRKLTVEDIKEARPGIFRGNLLIMRDLVANRRTELRWSNRVVDKPIPASMFTERELTRF